MVCFSKVLFTPSRYCRLVGNPIHRNNKNEKSYFLPTVHHWKLFRENAKVVCCQWITCVGRNMHPNISPVEWDDTLAAKHTEPPDPVTPGTAELKHALTHPIINPLHLLRTFVINHKDICPLRLFSTLCIKPECQDAKNVTDSTWNSCEAEWQSFFIFFFFQVSIILSPCIATISKVSSAVQLERKKRG